MSSEPSPAEIGRRLDTLSHDVRAGFEQVNLRLDKYVLGEVHALHVAHTTRELLELGKRLDEIERNRTDTFWRTVTAALSALSLLTAITVGVLALVIK